MMRRTGMRIISIVLTIAILAGYIYVPTSAVTEDFVQVDKENVTFEGKNGLGNLFADVLTEANESNNSDFNGGYSVIGVEVSGNTATVEYYAVADVQIFVAIYHESYQDLRASGHQLAAADQDTVTITLEGEMPEYFEVKVYMLSTLDYSPLCKTDISTMYTYAMQQLLASTVDDYDPDRVLNLDSSKENNFVVYRSEVVVVDYEEGKNIVTTCDDEKGITALMGDVNGDGRVNARDARALLRYIAGLLKEDEIDLTAADYNQDGRINARDARAVLRFIAGLD